MLHPSAKPLSRVRLPNLRSGRRGDIVAQVLIEIPKKLSDKQEKLLREFAGTEDYDGQFRISVNLL